MLVNEKVDDEINTEKNQVYFEIFAKYFSSKFLKKKWTHFGS